MLNIPGARLHHLLLQQRAPPCPLGQTPVHACTHTHASAFPTLTKKKSTSPAHPAPHRCRATGPQTRQRSLPPPRLRNKQLRRSPWEERRRLVGPVFYRSGHCDESAPVEPASGCRQALATRQNYNEPWHPRATAGKVAERGEVRGWWRGAVFTVRRCEPCPHARRPAAPAGGTVRDGMGSAAGAELSRLLRALFLHPGHCSGRAACRWSTGWEGRMLRSWGAG